MGGMIRGAINHKRILAAGLALLPLAVGQGIERAQAQAIVTPQQRSSDPHRPNDPVAPSGVKVPPTMLRVTKARLMDTTSRKVGAPCPVQESFVGDITTNGAGEIKYTWVSFDGGTWPEGTLHFSRPGTQRVSEHVTQGAAGKNVHGWLQLKVLSPNPVLSNRVPYTIICPGAGRVVRLVLSTNPVKGPVACPHQVNINGGVTTNGAADVTYIWTSSDNATWPHGTLHFVAAGTQPVKETWTVGGPGQAINGWVRLKVLSPNPLTSNPAVFRFQCAASR